MSEKDWMRAGTLAFAKRRAIVEAVEQCAYNMRAAAERLNIGRSTLYRLLSEYEIGTSLPVAIETTETPTIQLEPPPIAAALSGRRTSRLELRGGALLLVEIAEAEKLPTKLDR
jgi:transposase-like protein